MLKSSKTSVDEDDELNEPFRVSKKGPVYSPPSVIPKGHVRDSKNSSNSSLAQLIIPEEDSDSDNLEKPEVKCVRQDICCGPSLRSNLRNKHGLRHSRHRKAGEFEPSSANSIALVYFSDSSVLSRTFGQSGGGLIFITKLTNIHKVSRIFIAVN